jgi:hypothetical protein
MQRWRWQDGGHRSQHSQHKLLLALWHRPPFCCWGSLTAASCTCHTSSQPSTLPALHSCCGTACPPVAGTASRQPCVPATPPLSSHDPLCPHLCCCRLDAARPSFGDLPVLSSLTEALGRGMWKETMVVLTHANAAREAQGRDYFQLSKQRRSVLESLVGGGGLHEEGVGWGEMVGNRNTPPADVWMVHVQPAGTGLARTYCVWQQVMCVSARSVISHTSSAATRSMSLLQHCWWSLLPWADSQPQYRPPCSSTPIPNAIAGSPLRLAPAMQACSPLTRCSSPHTFHRAHRCVRPRRRLSCARPSSSQTHTPTGRAPPLGSPSCLRSPPWALPTPCPGARTCCSSCSP